MTGLVALAFAGAVICKLSGAEAILGTFWLGVTMFVAVGVHWTNAEFIPESISAIVLLALNAFIAYKRRNAVTWALGALRGGAGTA